MHSEPRLSTMGTMSWSWQFVQRLGSWFLSEHKAATINYKTRCGCTGTDHISTIDPVCDCKTNMSAAKESGAEQEPCRSPGHPWTISKAAAATWLPTTPASSCSVQVHQPQRLDSKQNVDLLLFYLVHVKWIKYLHIFLDKWNPLTEDATQ